MPLAENDLFPSARSIKHLLSPSLKSRVAFLDYRRSLWNSVEKYLKPVMGSSKRWQLRVRDLDFAWSLYLLILGARNDSDVVLSPNNQIQVIEAKKKYDLGSEGKTRLGILEGIFRAYANREELPGFRFNPTANLSERLEEIVEDAHMLEASHLRRLFGLQSNLMKLKRDLRKLTEFIIRNKKWAKGAINTADLAGYIPSGKPIIDLLESMALTSNNPVSPICLDHQTHIKNLITSEGWLFEIQSLNGGFALIPRSLDH